MEVQSPDLLSTADDYTAQPISSADENQFSEYFDREVKPLLSALEIERNAAIAKSKALIPSAVVIFIIGLIPMIALVYNGILVGETFFAFLLLILILVFWVNSPIRTFEASRDDQVIPKLVAYFPGFKYRRDAPPDVAEMYKAAVIPVGTSQKGGDRVHGSHQNTEIIISEVKTEETRGSGKNRHTVTLFNGIMVTMEFEKPFTGVTLVEREWGKQASVLPAIRDGRTLEVVSLEDPDFEKVFRVRSTDQVEARYLLTPDFMVRLHNLQESGKAHGLRCSFIDKKFYLAIPTVRDYFELKGAGSQIPDLEQALHVYRDVRDMIALIDILKINFGRRVRTGNPSLPPAA